MIDEIAKPDRFGKEELESLWSALHRLLYSKLKREDDDIVSFRNRFDEANRKIKKLGVNLPPQALGFIYLRQAQVDDLTLERIVTLTKGDLTLDSVIDAMRKLKMRLIQPEDDRKKPHVWMNSVDGGDIGSTNEPIAEVSSNNPVDDDEIDILESALRDLDEGPTEDEQISEHDARDILMTLIKQRVSRPVQQFSYKQVQNMKNDLKTGRGFRTPNTQISGGTKRDIQHLKSITQCRSCGATGHWHRECPNKSVSKPSQSSVGSSASSSHRDADSSQKAWWSLAESMEQATSTTEPHE